ncbi:peptidyl-prolyl cis-trans isomerase E [Polyplosphaeria fusca]|uniref:Peptidyl-prolyl cis-trans isomerase E n=1 Tax=Polyplosphaeria fusca TaxID=682080 RepID=A0A9P4RDD2_9PLEO|nr:peptidyl-prolyl cis-trans isomerase E [Polyplosphaeria fusca]
MTDASRLKATVYVGGLDQRASKQILHDLFEPFGEIVEVNLPKPDLPSSTDSHRGFGYVEFELEEDAFEAIDNVHNSMLFDRVLQVAKAKPQKVQGEGLGSKTAIWEQEGWLAEHAVSEEDRQAGNAGMDDEPMDPTQGLEGLDEAGPKAA